MEIKKCKLTWLRSHKIQPQMRLTTAQQSFQIYFFTSLFHSSYLIVISLQDSYSTNWPPSLSGKKKKFSYFILKTLSNLTTLELFLIHLSRTSSWKLVSPPVLWCPSHLISENYIITSLSNIFNLSSLTLFPKNLNMLNSQPFHLPFVNNFLSLPRTSFIKKVSTWCLLFTHFFNSKPCTENSSCPHLATPSLFWLL